MQSVRDLELTGHDAHTQDRDSESLPTKKIN